MTIERLKPHHAAAYRQLMLEAYALHPEAFTSSVAEHAALPLSWWESRLQTTSQTTERVLGGFIDGQLAGVVGLRFDTREKARHKATLHDMYVPVQFRRKGLGKRLLQAALGCAKEHGGVEIIQLTVTEGNLAAQTLYEQFGFVSFGLEPYAVALDAVDKAYVAKVHMWHSLEPALQTPNDFEHQIAAAEERLRLAMLASKVAVLDELISPQLVFTTHLGLLVNKQEDLAMHQSGVLKFHALEPSWQRISIFGSVAVVSVRMHMSGIHRGIPFTVDLHYTRIWQRTTNDAWKIIAGHSSVVPS
ncbi:MAG: GNAT family N-acetyltransferase [Burkholderiaceae bacterium]|nr:GNAT family N-acetyltransferase [Burkholderiaceae bacterium]